MGAFGDDGGRVSNLLGANESDDGYKRRRRKGPLSDGGGKHLPISIKRQRDSSGGDQLLFRRDGVQDGKLGVLRERPELPSPLREVHESSGSAEELKDQRDDFDWWLILFPLIGVWIVTVGRK